jgi:hypothetical protein
MARRQRDLWLNESRQGKNALLHEEPTPPAQRSQGRVTGTLFVGLCLIVSACAPRAPTGPTVMALPAKGEGFTVFQQHDTTCRQYATAQTGGVSPGHAAASSGVGGAVVGTGVGAAAGALLDSVSGHAGAGAAIGAGSGLLAGGLLGGARGQKSATAIQSRYNMSYTQCMVASSENMTPPSAPSVVYLAPYPSAVYVPPAIYVPPGGS